MFAIGDKRWPGVSKLVEELGELQQVCGKLMGSRGSTKHWSGDLYRMIHEEAGDVMAALGFLIKVGVLDGGLISTRMEEKLQVFLRWHREDPEQ